MTGRDRTAEFIATINSKREKPQWIQQRQNNSIEPQKISKLAIDPQYREFMRISQQCSHRIRDSFEKLEKFTLLAKKRTVFDDGEMNRLIAEIREDISESKKQLEYLQSRHEPKQKHSENIVTTLQQRLVNVTSNFKSTLEMRSRKVQQQSARQEMFTGASTSNSNNINLSNNYGNYDNLDNSNPLYANTRSTNYNDQQGMQQILQSDQIDLVDRADKMHLMESTIVELGTVFNQLAHMVQAQGETITRIDMNISDTAQNIESAHDALLRYFASINNNRWLMLKVFGVLFAFFIIFVVFGT